MVSPVLPFPLPQHTPLCPHGDVATGGEGLPIRCDATTVRLKDVFRESSALYRQFSDSGAITCAWRKPEHPFIPEILSILQGYGCPTGYVCTTSASGEAYCCQAPGLDLIPKRSVVKMCWTGMWPACKPIRMGVI